MVGNDFAKYVETLHLLKTKIRHARQKAILAVNAELLKVYWEIGQAILQHQNSEGWGSKIIDKLADDLKIEFPDMKGFSPRNLKYMRAFALAWPQFVQSTVAHSYNIVDESFTIVQQPVAQLPWAHHLLLLGKVKNTDERLFYIQKAIENGWSRKILEHQIDSQLHKTQGKLINNFQKTLTPSQSELTQQIFKDPYNFDFIMLGEKAKERDLEDALITHVSNVLLEMGAGFAFMGRQKRFEAGGREFFVDLLFYHTKLRRHIIIELKIGEFEPEYVSKMNLYLGLADDQLRGEMDEDSIGIILCKTNNRIVAEYALRDTSKPIGIAEYKIAEQLPEYIQGELPSIEELEQKVDEEIKHHQSPTDARIQEIKQKIKNFKGEEIQTKASFPILQSLYSNGIRSLYKEIIEKLNIFQDEFYSVHTTWYCTNKNFANLGQVDEFWDNEENLKNIFEFNFQVRLDGFKKAGTDHCNVSHTLSFHIDTYHYKFKLVNHNNQQPIVKKLYHNPLDRPDRQMIVDLIINITMDEIEGFLQRIGAN